jgi:zinc transport system substrate-binding protein
MRNKYSITLFHLVAKDPKHKNEYEKNFKKLEHALDDIDNQLKEITKDKQGNAVFISHESLGYLADRYGFEIFLVFIFMFWIFGY